MLHGAGESLPPLRVLLLEKRTDAAPDEVARQRLVGVRLVLDPLQLVLACIGEDLVARYVEQRAAQDLAVEFRLARHAASSAPACSTQEIHEHGLGLVVEVVREHQDLFRNLLEHVVSGGTRSRFQALAALLDFHFLDRERNAPALAELAAEI